MRLAGEDAGEARRFFTVSIVIVMCLPVRSRAPQLLLPESSSPPSFLSFSLSLCLSLALSLSFPLSLPGSLVEPAGPSGKRRAGGGGGDQRARDHARAVTASASRRAPSRRSTSATLASQAGAQARGRAGGARPSGRARARPGLPTGARRGGKEQALAQGSARAHPGYRSPKLPRSTSFPERDWRGGKSALGASWEASAPA